MRAYFMILAALAVTVGVLTAVVRESEGAEPWKYEIYEDSLTGKVDGVYITKRGSNGMKLRYYCGPNPDKKVSKFMGNFSVYSAIAGFDWDVEMDSTGWFTYETHGRMIGVGEEKVHDIMLSHPSNDVYKIADIENGGFWKGGYPTKKIMKWLESGEGVRIQLPLLNGRYPVNEFGTEGFMEALAECVKNSEAEYKTKPTSRKNKGDLY